MALLDIATDPRRFFEQRRDDLSLLPPAGVVVLVTAINVVAAYMMVQMTLEAMPAEAQQISGILYGSAIVGGLVGALVVWLLYAVVFHAISALAFDGDGSFTETLAVAGWGYVPKVVGALVSLAITYYVFQVQGVALPDATDPQAVQRYTQSLQNRPLFQVSTALSIVFSLWSAFIWTFGVSEVQDIEVRQAAIAVGVPVALSILWTLFNLV